MCGGVLLSMRIPDGSLLDLIEKAISWVSWGNSDSNSMPRGFEMSDNNCNMCCHCEVSILNSCLKYKCQSCGRVLCGKCVQCPVSSDIAAPSHLKETTEAVFNIKTCKLCFELGPLCRSTRRFSGKVYPSESPRQSPEPPSPSFSGERFDGLSPHALTRNSDESFSDHPSPVSVHRSPSRSDEDEGEDATSHFFRGSNEYFPDTSDIDSVCTSTRHEFYSFMSVGSSPSDSPSRIHITSNRVGHYVQQELGGTPRSQNDGSSDQEQAVLGKPAKKTWDSEKIDDLSIFQNKSEKPPQPPDFETNGLIWFPPPPDDVADEEENSFFTYDDEDDEVGDSGAMFSSNAGLDSMFSVKEKQSVDHKEPLRAVVQGHFRALVSQFLQGEGIISTKENCAQDWLNIITAIAWQAANFIKPDTSRGGSMDPCDYVKVKCVASGNPSESKLIKGVVCTKNIKHKRMTSQYKNTKLLLLGGALEYQRVPNQLASFHTLLQQENDHLKMIVSKIEAHHPNVLLVEKSVSSFAQDQLLAKEISLVLNVKRPLLERIARCTGATITPSIDHISTTRLGHCELFYLEKILEDHEPVNQFNKRPSKTLMFFEGCPRRLGCTVVLRGSSHEELKKVKNVVQYAIFAAYHLSLETSFLADEGASLPKMEAKSSNFIPEKMTLDKAISIPDSVLTTGYREEVKLPSIGIGSLDLNLELRLEESLSELGEVGYDDISPPDEFKYRKALSEACDENLALDITLDDMRRTCPQLKTHTPIESLGQVVGPSGEVSELAAAEIADDAEASSEYYSANDNNQSILVSFSSHCILNGTECERSRLLRVKFYGSSDKPLGRYLRDDLFDKSSRCRSCKESAEVHAIRYTHQNGNLTINVRRLSSVRLPGEEDGKIWMWHRCLRCTHIEGVPPATRRVVMSDAAWGLSFGKFLELSFSNYAAGNRVASCGHSLQRDCLRFYGFGSMIAFFQYSPINILSVRLPSPILEFSGPVVRSWMRKEASELLSKAKALYAEISAVLQEINQRSSYSVHELSDASELCRLILELTDMLSKEKNYYKDLLQVADKEIPEQDQVEVDILEINRLRHSLLIGSHVWDRRLYLLDSLLRRGSSSKAPNDVDAIVGLKASQSYLKDRSSDHEDDRLDYPKLEEHSSKALLIKSDEPKPEPGVNSTSLERLPSAASILSDKIDSAWSGADQAPVEAQILDMLDTDASESISASQINQKPSFRRLLSPTRVYSFDSAQRLQQRMRKVPKDLLTIQSFHASGDYTYMVRDPVSIVQRTYSQVSPQEAEKLNLTSSGSPSFISSISVLPKGARLMVPPNGPHDIVVPVYDDEPTSMISFALSSKKYVDWVADKPNGPERGTNASLINKVNSIASDFSTWPSFGSVDLDFMHYGYYGSEDASATVGPQFMDLKNSPHLRISFEDESPDASGKVKFSVTCYLAKQFDALRRSCCPTEVDFVRSLSRCRRWSAQGGKSNVYFAKSLDERFIIKQLTKTELESFDEFAPEYFKYLTDALSFGGPTCLAKVLGIYQVAIKHSKGSKETKMDLMVMENLFFGRSISKVYDLKGSARSRYNSDTTGANKVLLDMNLLRTNPIFLGSNAKRRLERAVWNDTFFLSSIDVMDYSLLVGVDEEKKELVLGIIDYMRQYTWDKHLETWVKASGILGGPKNASPTIISPKQYKKRFRKAMTTYFLTVPDQWSS